MRASFTREDADIRRQAMIEATAESMAETGIGGTSVRSICARAGVSPGLLRHYFDGIDALIAETYRSVIAMVSESLAKAVEDAGPNSRKRLIAYVTASFRAPVADPALLSTWLAFWSLVKTDPTIAKIHAESYADSRRDLEALLTENGLTAAQANPAAIALTALVDGLWLELTLDATTFTPEQAGAMAIRWLDTLLERPEF